MMTAIRLDDGRLRVPRRVEQDGIIGDGVVEIGPEDPEYQRWDQWLKRLEAENQQKQQELRNG